MTPYLDRVPAGTGRPRLFCFHHAGGGASAFAGWRAALAPHLDVFPVQLPGREGRACEPPFRDLDALVSDLDVHIGPHLRGRFLFYGHSLGALVAYRLAAHRVASALSVPDVLVAGGYPPPDTGAPTGADPAARAAVAGRLGRFPRWARAATALLEHDLALVASHRPARRPPLPVPVHAVTGSADPLVSAADAQGWAGYTSAGCWTHVVPGGHLFLRDSPAAVQAVVVTAMTTTPGRNYVGSAHDRTTGAGHCSCHDFATRRR